MVLPPLQKEVSLVSNEKNALSFADEKPIGAGALALEGRRIGTGHLHPHLQVRVYRRIKGVACCSFEPRHHKAVKEIQVTMDLTRRAQKASAAPEKWQSIAAQMSARYFFEQESRSPIYREEGVTLSSLRRVVKRFCVAQPLPKRRQSPSTFY